MPEQTKETARPVETTVTATPPITTTAASLEAAPRTSGDGYHDPSAHGGSLNEKTFVTLSVKHSLLRLCT